MSNQTTAHELRAAATRLRETATKALAGPWSVDEDGTAVFSADMAPYGAPCVVPKAAEEDATWIALVHPGLAKPLADLLERMADIAAHAQPGYKIHALDAALTVARVILGGDRA